MKRAKPRKLVGSYSAIAARRASNLEKQTVMQPDDCRTKEDRLWEINRMLNTGMYRTGTLTELVNTKHALEREIADEKNKPL